MLRLSRIGTAFSFALILSLTACGPDQGTTAPSETTQEDLDRQREEARQKAMAAGLIGQARTDIQAGNYISARKRAEEAIAANPKDADAYGVLGAAYWRAGEYELSTKAFREGLALDPGSFPVAIGLARNLQAGGLHEEAILLSDALIALESKDFNAVACQPASSSAQGEEAGGKEEEEESEEEEEDEEDSCEMGWCNPDTNMCTPNRQVSPRLQKLWSQYLLMDVESGLESANELFIGAVGGDEAQGQINIAASYRDFLQAFAGQKDLISIVGEEGSSSLGLDTAQGLKYTGAVVGGEFASTVIQELQNETRINKALADTLKLKVLAKIKPITSAEEMAVVLIPEIKIGELTIKNVPALVDDLSMYSSIGEVPGLSLGRQVLHRLGSISFDFAGRSMVVTKSVPGTVEGAHENPLLFMDTFYSTVPVTSVSLDGSDRRFWTWFGGIYPAGIGVTQKEFLKSGKHRPSELENPEDADRGLKMVYVDQLSLGDFSVSGVGGLVFISNPPDAGLESVTSGVGFELGGYVNFSVIQKWKVTYVLQQGKIYIQAPAVTEG